jgi:hypothetical protein
LHQPRNASLIRALTLLIIYYYPRSNNFQNHHPPPNQALLLSALPIVRHLRQLVSARLRQSSSSCSLL